MRYILAFWEFLKKIFSGFSFKDWVILLLAAVALCAVLSARHYYRKTLFPQIVYMTDSLEIYKNKLGEEYAARDIYVQTIGQLKDSNAELYAEVKRLKDHPVVVTKTRVETRIDTVYAVSDSVTSPEPGARSLHWHVDEPSSFYSISGRTDVDSCFSGFSTVLTNVIVPATLTIDVVEDSKNSKLRVIARSDNPYVRVADMSGVVIDPSESKVMKSYFRPKRWSVGPQIGYGFNDRMRPGYYIGVGVSYALWQF